MSETQPTTNDPNIQRIATETNSVPGKITEEDFLVDYYRFASKINAHSAVAHKEHYAKVTHNLDKRAIFVAQKYVFLNSHEDLAQILNALHLRHMNGTRIHHTLADDADSLSQFSKDIGKFETSSDLLNWVGIDREKLIEAITSKSNRPPALTKKWIDGRVGNIATMLSSCKKDKLLRQKVCNAIKHGKAVLSTDPPSLYGDLENSNAQGPHFFHYKKVNEMEILFSNFTPFTDQQFQLMVEITLQISTVIRELLLLFIVQYYPGHVKYLHISESEMYEFDRQSTQASPIY